LRERRDSAFAIRGGPLPGIRGRAEETRCTTAEWADEAEMRGGVDSLLGRIAALAPQEIEEEAPVATVAEITGRGSG